MDVANPAPEWITDRIWLEILTLESLEPFKGFAENFHTYLQDYKKIFDSTDPERATLPQEWADGLDDFQKIIFLKCLRPDKVTNAMQDFVSNNLGQKFIEPQTADLHLVFRDSSATTPLIFVLSVGTDPAADLYKFAEEMKFSKRLNTISLGQGQGPRAESLMRAAMEKGQWVFFQNCHLSPSWMPSLERLVEQVDPDHVHKDFRLWLTSMPSPQFPVMILQNGSKMTVEPPRGIKANLLRSYITLSDDFLTSCTGKVDEFKHLLLSLCLFHAVLLERRKFGPLGFNIPYEFTDGDLRICMSQLRMFLMEYTEIAYKVLKYTAGEINYGGRVTDDWDRRCVMNVLDDFYAAKVLDANFCYDDSQIYHQLPPVSEHQAYVGYVRSLPINDTPEIFGLHENANITFAQNETYRTLTDLLDLQPKTATAGENRDVVIEKLVKDVLSRVPRPLPLATVMEKYPVMYEQVSSIHSYMINYESLKMSTSIRK
ncbi:unnamed protein product [Rotaria socialis]|uniref:Dynein heavy chain n=1 Tax=Rotaria socialis TaxID=392032 RepID=A0A817TMR6_9BILA|nr:unnamed protein product [Rotaria socialis]